MIGDLLLKNVLVVITVVTRSHHVYLPQLWHGLRRAQSRNTGAKENICYVKGITTAFFPKLHCRKLPLRAYIFLNSKTNHITNKLRAERHVSKEKGGGGLSPMIV